MEERGGMGKEKGREEREEKKGRGTEGEIVHVAVKLRAICGII